MKRNEKEGITYASKVSMLCRFIDDGSAPQKEHVKRELRILCKKGDAYDRSQKLKEEEIKEEAETKNKEGVKDGN